MKQIVCVVFLCWACFSAKAQVSLCLSTDKTTSLVFPFAIKHVDRGTPSVLALQVKDVPTILLVKAGSKNFSETNLSVVTEDGSLYSFSICYDGNPAKLVYHLPIQLKTSIETYANGIIDNPKTVSGISDKKWAMQVEISGIYVKDNVIYYQLLLQNNSPIDYDIDVIRFYISDNQRSKRTAIQEVDLEPIHISGNTTIVKAANTSTIVYAFNKLTIPDAKFLGVQIMEKNGGRHLSMKISNRKLMQAIPLPDLK